MTWDSMLWARLDSNQGPTDYEPRPGLPLSVAQAAFASVCGASATSS